MSNTSRKPGIDTRQMSLVVVFLTVVIDLLGFGMVLPLLPVYARELTSEFSPAGAKAMLGLLMISYSLMQMLFEPLWSRVSDYVGRRPILILSLAGSATCYALFGLATSWRSLAWMFAARIAGGIAGSTIPTAQAYIADITPVEGRARGMAIIGAAFGLGFTLGPLVGAAALWTAGQSRLSPWPGFLAAGLSIVALSLALFTLQESIHHRESVRQARRHVNLRELRESLRVPSVGLLLIALFICTFGFAAFEGTFSLVMASFLKVAREDYKILLAFAYIGFVQTLVQGGLVRWMTTFIGEGVLSVAGAVVCVLGYVLMAMAADPGTGGVFSLIVAASVVVSGMAFVYPSVSSLLSRRSDPTRQGGVMGVGGSLGTLARITGIELAYLLMNVGQPAPFWISAGLMMAVLVLIMVAVRAGKDFPAVEEAAA